MNHSPLQTALDWWAARDSMGGFARAAAQLFPGWTPRRSCRAPHRQDASPSFSLYRNTAGAWRFKDHATGEQGGLVAFVMLAGMDGGSAARWLIGDARLNDEAQMTNDETRRKERPRGEGGNMTKPECRRLAQTPLLASSFGLHSDFVIRHSSFSPYCLNESEIQRCASMSATLAQNCTGSVSLAAARGWRPETIHTLALDGSLGLHEGRLVMIYPTGAKKRLKPLAPASLQMVDSTQGEAEGRGRQMASSPSPSDKTPWSSFYKSDGGDAIPTSSTNGIAATPRVSSKDGPPFLWLFGKPDAPWRSHLLRPSTTRVHITEGETDAITLINAGLECGHDDGNCVVLAIPGASCWRDAWAAQFRGLRVTLWPDADSAGERLTTRIISSLAPFVKSIETVTQ